MLLAIIVFTHPVHIGGVSRHSWQEKFGVQIKNHIYLTWLAIHLKLIKSVQSEVLAAQLFDARVYGIVCMALVLHVLTNPPDMLQNQQGFFSGSPKHSVDS
jgi:hypothetical protein